MLMIFTKMVNGCVDDDFPEPAFEGTDSIRIGRFKPVYFDKYLQKPVVQDLDGIFFIVGIQVADRHGISIERTINFFLALPFVQGASLDMYF